MENCLGRGRSGLNAFFGCRRENSMTVNVVSCALISWIGAGPRSPWRYRIGGLPPEAGGGAWLRFGTVGRLLLLPPPPGALSFRFWDLLPPPLNQAFFPGAARGINIDCRRSLRMCWICAGHSGSEHGACAALGPWSCAGTLWPARLGPRSPRSQFWSQRWSRRS